MKKRRKPYVLKRSENVPRTRFRKSIQLYLLTFQNMSHLQSCKKLKVGKIKKPTLPKTPAACSKMITRLEHKHNTLAETCNPYVDEAYNSCGELIATHKSNKRKNYAARWRKRQSIRMRHVAVTLRRLEKHKAKLLARKRKRTAGTKTL